MDTSEIKSVIQNYFNACFESSGERFREVFHDAAHIYSGGEGGALNDRDREAFISYVEARKSSGPTPDFPRQEEILSIDFVDENTAVARVKVRVGGMLFTDILSFIRFDGKWMIISKVYSGVPV